MSAKFFGITTRSFHYAYTIGRDEFFGPGFKAPIDLAVGQDEMIYVPNRSKQGRLDGVRVTVFTMGEDYLKDFGRYGERDGEFVWPISIAVNSSGNVFLADQWLNRISIYDKGGEFLDKWGEAGSDDGQLNQPFGMAFDREDNLYVVDGHNNRIQRFTKDGKFLAKWGEAGTGPGQFNLPWGITIDSRGDVYVPTGGNDRVQKFTADGRYLAEFGSSGDGVGQFHRPSDVAVDKDGDIYVTDWGNNRVQVLTPDGRHITTFPGDATVSKWGVAKLRANPDMIKQRELIREYEPWKRFWNPVAIEVDSQGRILVVDCQRHRIQVYQKDNY